jgi:hypothetical protein
MRNQLRTDNEAPNMKKSNTETEEPKRTKLLTDKELHMSTESAASMVFWRLKLPPIESFDPNLTKPRNDNELPTIALSITEMDAPSLNAPRTENDEAKRKHCLNAIELPK